LFRGPFFPLTLDPHDLQSVEAGSNPFDYHGTIDMANDLTIRLKLPLPAAMNC